MEINLLPQPSTFEKYRVLILASVTVFLGALLLGGLFYWISLTSQLNSAKAELNRYIASNAALKAERTVPPSTKQFQDLQAALNSLKDQQHNYGTMLDGIAKKLSDKMKVTAVEMDGDAQTVTLDLRIDSIETVADYAQLLRSEPWVQDVFVDTIQNEQDKDKQAGSTTQPTTGPAQPATSLPPYSTRVIITLAPEKVAAPAPAAVNTKKK